MVEAAGPGFINLKLADTALAPHRRHANKPADQLVWAYLLPSEPLNVLIDFAGPNMAKPMHVGHLRATIIGDSLQRIAESTGP